MVRHMGILNPNKKNKSEQKKNGKKKPVKYVYLSSKKVVFIVTGEPKGGKYGYGVPIIPVHGVYYSSKDKRKYTAKELGDYYIILNIDKEDVDAIKGKKLVVMGYKDNEVLVVPANGEKDDGNKA
jgi:hypothetical protein